MAAHLEKLNVGHARRAVAQEFFQAERERGVGHEAAAGRRRVIGDAQLARQLHLLAARPPRDAHEPLAVDQALALGLRGRERLG